MTQLNSVLNKPVINRASSAVSGNIDNVYLSADGKNIAYFYIKNEDENMLLPYAEIRQFSDATVIDSDVNLLHEEDVDLTSLCPSPMGKSVYTYGGQLIGTVDNLFFSNSGKVIRYTAGPDRIIPSQILAVGDVVLLKGTVRPKQKTRIPRPEHDYPVYILDDEGIENGNYPADNRDGYAYYTQSQTSYKNDTNGADSYIGDKQNDISPQNTEQQSADIMTDAADIKPISLFEIAEVKPVAPISLNQGEPAFTQDALETLLGKGAVPEFDGDGHTPTRIICDYQFLLGRVLRADLNTYAGELIAAKGSEVTAAIVESARRAGKLVELTLSSNRE